MTTDSTIRDYELENYWGIDDAQISHFKKRRERLAKMTDEERTARRKKFQKILKIGAVVGAVTAIAVFSPQIMASLAPVFKSMKSALLKKGINVKSLKPGQVAEKFSTEVAGIPVPEGQDKAKVGLKLAKNILGWFASAKKRREDGTATELEKSLLDEADKVTDRISKLSESDAAKTIKNLITEGTADEGEDVGSNSGNTKDLRTSDGASGGMDIKKYLPIALVVLGVIFFMKRG